MGLGASIPKEEEIKRQKASTDEILRRQLLGRDYKKLQPDRARDGSKPGLGVGHVGVKPRPASVKRPVDESDDEGGRSWLGRSKRQKLDKELQNGITEAAGTGGVAVLATAATAAQAPQRRKIYLDEVLAEKSHKKSKKKKKRNRPDPVPIAADSPRGKIQNS